MVSTWMPRGLYEGCILAVLGGTEAVGDGRLVALAEAFTNDTEVTVIQHRPYGPLA